MEVADFGGYATKNDLLCSDGRTIRAGAFAHQNGQKVPLVWQHQHNNPENVLGHALLENRKDGVYSRAFFNDSPAGQNAKLLVEHGDVDSLSIYATKLKQNGKNVMHGDILEVSLVLSGANPEAFIDFVNLAHSNGSDGEDEAIIYPAQELEQGDIPEAIELAGDTTENEGEIMADQLEHASTDEKSVKDVYEAMSQEQKDVLHFLVGEAIESKDGDTAEHSNFDGEEFLSHVNNTIQEGFNTMGRNVFEQNGSSTSTKQGATLSHSQLENILADGSKYGSLKESVLAHATEYGIENVDFLFPDAKLDANGISFLSRRTEWVADVLTGTKHSPFSRIKSIVSDITADEARAKGYVKGNRKKDEIIKLLKRVTTPTTVYKKQKLDRDDIVDITEVDVILWLKAEMRLMLDEEIARSILVGDGREPDDIDKIDEDHLRPIAFDDDMYNTVVELDASPTPAEMIEQIVRSRKYYKGTGTPSFYTTDDVLTDLILDKDSLGRRFYATEAELAAALRVKSIVTVEAMESVAKVVGIIVNLADYTVGADKGGEINLFDDFDIDYNQQKYLIETRISGALTKPKSAVTIRYNMGTVVTPNAPTFVAATGVVTIPAQTGVVYKNQETLVVLTAGAQPAIAAGATVNIVAVPAAGYSFPHNFDADWTFTRLA